MHSRKQHRPDLGDRANFLTLAPIGEAQRRPEAELWREFEIDAVVHGLRALARVHLDRLPRMADFALWATACETALRPAGSFARAYAANRTAAIEGLIEADPVATCELMAEQSTWTGRAADLLRAGGVVGDEAWTKSAGWKKTGRSPVDCGGRRCSCGRWASRSRSLVKAEQGQG